MIVRLVFCVMIVMSFATSGRAADPAGPMLVLADPVVIPATVAELPIPEAERAVITGSDPAARREAALVASGQAELYVGAHASHDRLTTPRAREARVIHFAVPAFWNSDEPSRSALVLAGVDGLLTPDRIAALGLSPELVTISRTPPRAASEEASRAVAQAFLSAGARTVVAPRAPVEGAAAAAIMERFYAGLRRGQSIDAALAAADPRGQFLVLGAGASTVPSLVGARTAVQTRMDGLRVALGTLAAIAVTILALRFLFGRRQAARG